MNGYTLTVFAAGSPPPIEVINVSNAAAAMAAIPKLVESHPGCERIRVMAGATYLFSVDCTGATLPE